MKLLSEILSHYLREKLLEVYRCRIPARRNSICLVYFALYVPATYIDSCVLFCLTCCLDILRAVWKFCELFRTNLLNTNTSTFLAPRWPLAVARDHLRGQKSLGPLYKKVLSSSKWPSKWMIICFAAYKKIIPRTCRIRVTLIVITAGYFINSLFNLNTIGIYNTG